MSTLAPDRTLTKCWKTNPAECRIHGSNAGFNALKDLNKAKDVLNSNLTNQDDFDKAKNALSDAQGIYDATPEGLMELQKEIDRTSDPVAKGLLEERLRYVEKLNQIEESFATQVPSGIHEGALSFDGERDAQLDQIKDALEKGVANLSSSEGFKAYLDSAAAFHNYSFNNQMLIMLQTGGKATHVASYRSWAADHERQVTKGEKAIKILAPINYKKVVTDRVTGKDEEKTFTAFKAVPVFDISQTTGKELPKHPSNLLEGEAPEGLIGELESKIEATGYKVRYEEINGGANGYTSRSGEVVIDSRLSNAQRAKTLAHERAHIELGHMERNDYHTGPGGCRGDMEVEAEGVAYIVTHAKGLDSGDYSFGYIAGWAQGDTTKLKTLGSNISKAAKSILG